MHLRSGSGGRCQPRVEVDEHDPLEDAVFVDGVSGHVGFGDGDFGDLSFACVADGVIDENGGVVCGLN